MLEELFAQAGLANITTGEVNCPFIYHDFTMFWEANVSAGPLQGMLQVITEGELQKALEEAIHPFLLDDGSIVIQNNKFKYVTAKL